jgi:hypothetical protein
MVAPLKSSPSPDLAAPLFHADRPDAPALGAEPALDLLADLTVHQLTQTPLTIGIFGAPGAGKSHALRGLAARAKGLAGQARQGDPFLNQVAIIQIEAPQLRADPINGLASALHEGLLARGADSEFAMLSAKALEAATDPQAAAQEASQGLADTRARLAVEERTLDELRARRGRISEAVLFEARDSGIDDYVRRHRKQLEAGLKTFGFTGDASAVYKDLVRELIDRPGPLSRMTAFADSVWAYAGQVRLLIWALALSALGWAFATAETTRGDWLASLRDMAESAREPANWIEAHANWLSVMSQTALIAAGLCLALNIWRAGRFTMPLLRGLRLLETEVDQRRNELDRLIARQTQIADQLASENEALSQRAKATEQRTRERTAAGALSRRSLFSTPGAAFPIISAAAYLGALEAGLGARGGPQRIVILLDGLEALPAQEAAALVDATRQGLNRSGFVLVMAADADHLTAGWGGAAEAAARLARHVQVSFNVRMVRDQQASIAYAHQLLGAAPEFESAPLDASRSALDHALKPVETHLLGKLASLAGDRPRSVKRYLNAWRLARPLTEDGGALALMLALDNGATSGELAAMGAAMDLEEPDAPLVIHPGEPRLAAALASVNALRSSPLTNGQAHAAWMIARDYAIPEA